MAAANIPTSEDIEHALTARDNAPASIHRLLGLEFCRRIWSLMPERSQLAIEMAEQAQTEPELRSALDKSEESRRIAREGFRFQADIPKEKEAAAWAAAAAVNACRGMWFVVGEMAAKAVASQADAPESAYLAERRAQYALLVIRKDADAHV